MLLSTAICAPTAPRMSLFHKNHTSRYACLTKCIDQPDLTNQILAVLSGTALPRITSLRHSIANHHDQPEGHPRVLCCSYSQVWLVLHWLVHRSYDMALMSFRSTSTVAQTLPSSAASTKAAPC